jgi:hypothetical protein
MPLDDLQLSRGLSAQEHPDVDGEHLIEECVAATARRSR